jgi:large subunit ribosomal protein L18
MSKIIKKNKSKNFRSKISGNSHRPRLCVSRSNKYIYAQIIDDQKGTTIVASDDRKLQADSKKAQNRVELAGIVGEEIAKKAKTKKISQVVFDRGIYRYHGRVKAVADGARKGGLIF